MIFCQWLYRKGYDIYSRRGAEFAENFKTLLLFNPNYLCLLCASARKQAVKPTSPAIHSAKRKHAATIKLSRSQYNLLKRPGNPWCEQTFLVQLYDYVKCVFSMQFVLFLKAASYKQTMTDEVDSAWHTTAEFVD